MYRDERNPGITSPYDSSAGFSRRRTFVSAVYCTPLGCGIFSNLIQG